MDTVVKIIGVAIILVIWFVSDKYIRLLSKRMTDAARSHNKRIDKTQLDLEDYLSGNSHIKNADWIKQQNDGKIFRKKFKVHDYSNGYNHIVNR